MKQGAFYFLSNQYYIDFPDNKLMKSKETVNGISHSRPCFFAFQDNQSVDVFWLVPISSKYDKYKAIYEQKIAKYGKCNTIRFGEVLGTNAAFLIQNMCPVTENYINEIYSSADKTPIAIDNRISKDIISNAREVLAKQERGAQLIFPDVFKIKQALIEQLTVARTLPFPEVTAYSTALHTTEKESPYKLPEGRKR